MRVRVRHIALRGTDRVYSFEPGLNIIQGEIATGKTSLMQLIHGLFGSSLENLIPEIQQQVTHIEGSLVIGDEEFVVVRPVTSTSTAKVEVAGRIEALRLPALALDATADRTYGQWLLERLGLPQLQIAVSETRPDSATTPVSINDYFLYCHLRWNEIDTSVFGHHDPFKNKKRMVVFRIIYGLYDADAANLEEQLRSSTQLLRETQQRIEILQQTFAGTPFENRADLIRRRDFARQALLTLEAAITDEGKTALDSSATAPQPRQLRESVIELDREVGRLRLAARDELGSADQLRQLVDQLRAQSRRLTKSIVADRFLLDYDFYRCPRCNSSVDAGRGDVDRCYLCLQPPSPALTRADLEREQQRLDRQLIETQELIANHETTVQRIDQTLAEVLAEREQKGKDLDYYMRTYVSDTSERVGTRAAERAELQGDLRRYTDYLEILNRLEHTSAEMSRLEREIERLKSDLELAESKQANVGDRFNFLDDRLERLLDTFNAPRSAERSAAHISRTTFLPVVDGRPFDNLHSPGLTVQVNVAYAIANHLAALNFDLALPNILLIDGFTSNIGTEGFDPQRRRRMYSYMIELSRRHGDRLQVIVADNDVPDLARDFVRVSLSESERLIPLPTDQSG